MPDPAEGDLEGRLSELEREVARLKDGVEISRADAAAARVLAGGADRDVSDVKALLRAHTQALHALRDSQIEHGQKLARLDTRMSGLDAKLDQMDAKVDRALGLLSTGMAQIVAVLGHPRREGSGSEAD